MPVAFETEYLFTICFGKFHREALNRLNVKRLRNLANVYAESPK
jgi:hypothetical protein